MFHTPIDTRSGMSSSTGRILAWGGQPPQFPAALDLCREQVPDSGDCVALRFAAEARKSSSGNAFRPAFATGDWRVFSSYCIARRLPADHRVLIPGRSDRTLRFVVEGSLWQESAACAGAATNQPKLLLPGAIVGEDTLFLDGPCELDVRTLEETLLLELSLPRQKEMTASCPEIGFELMRAAGAVIAARGRSSGLRAELAAN
jgi:CRP-like cAMP-binding protein